MNGVGGQLDFRGTAFDELALLEGERVETSLNLLGETADPKDGDGRKTARWRWGKNPLDVDMLVLTDRRLIHLVYNASERESAFVSLPAVSAVRMDAHRPGRAPGFIWCGISLLAATLLWAVWDQPVLDVVAAGVVVLMGLYILLDYVMAPHAVQMTISAGASQMTMGVHWSISTQRVNDFANRVFEAKANAQHPVVAGWPLDTAGSDDIYAHSGGIPGVPHAYGQEAAPDVAAVADVGAPDVPAAVEDVGAPDATLQGEDAPASDTPAAVADAAVPDVPSAAEDAAAPDDVPHGEDAAVPDVPAAAEDVGAPDATLQGEDVGAPDDAPAVEDVAAPDALAVADVGAPDDAPAVADVAAPDDVPSAEDAAAPDALAVEDVAAPDAPAAVADVAAPDAPVVVADVGAPDDAPAVEDVAAPDALAVAGAAAPDATLQGEDLEAPDAPAVVEDAAAPDDSSGPSGSDRVESGEALAKRGDDSSPAVGSSGQS